MTFAAQKAAIRMGSGSLSVIEPESVCKSDIEATRALFGTELSLGGGRGEKMIAAVQALCLLVLERTRAGYGLAPPVAVDRSR